MSESDIRPAEHELEEFLPRLTGEALTKILASGQTALAKAAWRVATQAERTDHRYAAHGSSPAK